MKHIYLSISSINEALENHSITEKEARKLYKKVDCQVTIYKATHHKDEPKA
jgi:hypothetical protein